MLDSRRVAEIVVTSAGERGTGYVLCDRCILTAHHVVRGAANSTASDAIRFRLLGDEAWPNASLVWSDPELDLALLEFTHTFSSLTFDLPRLVSPEAYQKRVSCNAVGFPEFRKKEQEKTFFDDYCLEGWIKPTKFDGTKTPSQLLMEIEGSIPPTVESWQGVSGAAIFSTDGGLAGVLLRVPRNLGGQQIHAVSLNWAIDRYPSLAQELDERFQKSFEIDDRQRQIARLKEERRVLKRRRNANETRLDEIDDEIEEREGEEKLTGYDPDKSRLKQELIRLEKYDRKVLENAWTYLQNKKYVNSFYRFELNARNICDELGIAIDKTLTYRFLERAIVLLELKEKTDEAAQLVDRLRNLLPLFPQPEPSSAPNDTETAPLGVTSLLLFGLEIVKMERDRVEYSLSIHHVPDSTAYQQRVQENESLEEVAKPLKLFTDELTNLDVQLADRDRLAFSTKPDEVDTIRQILNATVRAVFDTYPKELDDDRLHIYFYLPKSLLILDCHNLEFELGLLSLSLGIEYPVVVTCFDRHKQNEKAKTLWRKRWGGLGFEPRNSLQKHICGCNEQTNGKPLDFENPQELYKQLKQMGDAQRATLVGLRFAGSEIDFQDVCDTLFAVGLSLFLYPSTALTPTETKNCERALGETCVDDFLVALKDRYRCYADDHAGSLSVLIDNPDLPPIQLEEIDY